MTKFFFQKFNIQSYETLYIGIIKYALLQFQMHLSMAY